MYTFAVVTEVPTPEKGGNYSLPGRLYVVEKVGYPEKLVPIDGNSWLHIRQPVFNLGEILILSEDGREPHGMGRNPDKWHVRIEYFEDLKDAVLRSEEIQNQEYEPK